MSIKTFAFAAAVLLAGLAAVGASAQTYSGGRTGARGHGYTYSVNRSGPTVTGGVQTNGGYGATATHTGGTNAYGARYGSSSVTTNNGSNVSTHAYGKNGYAAGTITATGPNGQSASRSGAVYVPH